MRILVTNDDGIDSTGLHVLARAMRPHGDVVIVAPDREFSGCGAALGTLHEIHPEVHRCEVDGVAESWSVTGPPGLCILFARLGVFGQVDLVVSGINPGANVGRAVYHSGTVGAALTARNGRISGVAVSQAVEGFGVDGQAWDDMIQNQKWHSAAAVAAEVVGGIIEAGLDEAVVVNINVPNLEIEDMLGWKHTEVGVVPPRTVTQATLEPKAGHEDTFNVKMGWGEAVELPTDIDGGAVEAGYVSISYLSRLHAVERIDMAPAEFRLDDLLGD